MRVHLGRATLVTVALAELGAIVGASLCSAFLIAWMLLHRHGGYGIVIDRGTLLGMVMWGALVGAPLGAVALPVVGLTVLRRTPLGRALAFPLGGMFAGLTVATIAVTGPAMWPVPPLVPAFAVMGLLTGVLFARRVPQMTCGDTRRVRT